MQLKEKIAVVVSSQTYAEKLKRLLPWIDFIPVGSAMSGHRWDRIIVTTQIDFIDDQRELEKTLEWLNHLRCKLVLKGEMIYV